MAKYTITRAAQPSTLAGSHFTGNCYCPGCNQPILAGQLIREQAIYKCGQLDYVAVGHGECCPEYDNAEIPESDFDFELQEVQIPCVCMLNDERADPACRDCSGKGWFLG